MATEIPYWPDILPGFGQALLAHTFPFSLFIQPPAETILPPTPIELIPPPTPIMPRADETALSTPPTLEVASIDLLSTTDFVFG